MPFWNYKMFQKPFIKCDSCKIIKYRCKDSISNQVRADISR